MGYISEYYLHFKHALPENKLHIHNNTWEEKKFFKYFKTKNGNLPLIFNGKKFEKNFLFFRPRWKVAEH